MSKKKTALMPLLVILSLAVIIIVVISIVLTPFFQPTPSPQPKQEEADKTRIATNYSNSTQTAAIVSPPPAPIDVVSTTTAFPFVQRWAAQYENQQLGSSGNVNIDYLDERQIKEDRASEKERIPPYYTIK